MNFNRAKYKAKETSARWNCISVCFYASNWKYLQFSKHICSWTYKQMSNVQYHNDAPHAIENRREWVTERERERYIDRQNEMCIDVQLMKIVAFWFIILTKLFYQLAKYRKILITFSWNFVCSIALSSLSLGWSLCAWNRLWRAQLHF